MKFSTVFQVAFALGVAGSAVAAPAPDDLNARELVRRELDRRADTILTCVKCLKDKYIGSDKDELQSTAEVSCAGDCAKGIATSLAVNAVISEV